MKKHSKTTTVYRIDLEKGKYTTISRSILMNPNLKDSSKTLLQLALNNKEDWRLILSYYKKHLNWSNDKLASAVADLIQNGYLKKQKHSKGKGKGFYYTYIISEFGNLNPNKSHVEVSEILECAKQEETISDSNLTTKETKATEIQPPQETLPVIVNDEFWEKVITVIHQEVSDKANDVFFNKVLDYYIERMNAGKLTALNFNEVATREILQTKIAARRKTDLIELNRLIDLYNDSGTKDQRANIKKKALIYFNESISSGIEIKEADVSLRITRLKLSVIEANRNLDQRYQN